ncbi:hypothetical protein ScPMuIL_018496 [Solemya velum]
MSGFALHYTLNSQFFSELPVVYKYIKSLFFFRNPPHPFITIITNRPDSWLPLQQEIYRLCCHDSKRIRQQAFEILGPFIRFALLEPQQTEQYQPMRSSLQRVLLQICDQSDSRVDVFKTLADLIPCFQLRTENSLGEAMQFLAEILSEGLHHVEPYKETMARLTTLAVDLCLLCARKKMSCGYLAKRILVVGQTIPEILSTDNVIVMLFDLMSKMPVDDSLVILQIVKLILKNSKDLCPLVVGMATLSVLQLLSLPKSGKQEVLLKRLNATAGEVMTLIESILQEGPKPLNKSIEQHTLLSSEGHQCQIYAEHARYIYKNVASRRSG